MAGRFAGKNVMVTGAGTGFGATLAERAAQDGAATVVVHYRSSAKGAEETAERVRAAGANALLVQADIVSWDQIRAMADTVFGELGELHGLVNNVGDMASGQNSWPAMSRSTNSTSTAPGWDRSFE